MKRSKIVILFLIIFVVIAAAIPLLVSREWETINEDTRRTAPGKFIRLSQGYTHYEISGPVTGQPVILVHGFSVPYYIWDPTFKALQHSKHRVIRYDLYGRGFSDRPDTTYDRRLFVEQLRELIDSLEIKGRVHLAGVSMGGAVVAAFAADHPDRAGKIVLVDPVCGKTDIGPLSIPGIGDYLAYSFYIPSTPKSQLNDFYRPERFPDWTERYRVQMRFKGFGRAILSTARNFISIDPVRDYEKLALSGKPVLLIWGTGDTTIGKERITKLRKLLKPEFLEVHEAGHIPQYESPEKVNPAIIQFLSM